MYDFYFGDKNDVFSDELKYLLTIKRMMPRWCNSIPDSEFCAIYNDFVSNDKITKGNGVVIETGCGASTIVLAFLAFKYNKILYSWDTNQNKLSYIRQIICDTHQRIFGKSLHNHWCYIGYLSNSDELGIGILKELDKTIDFAFFDSEHTADTLLSEIRLALSIANNGSVFAFDDANYDYKYKNISYINIFRKKLGLSEIKRSEDNLSSKFYILAQDEILKSFPNSFKNIDTYKKDFKTDIFWQYFSNDREIMNSMGMEKMLELEHRYDSYTIVK